MLDHASASSARASDKYPALRGKRILVVEDDAVIIPLWWTTRAVLTQPRIERTFAVFQGYEHIETWRVKSE